MMTDHEFVVQYLSTQSCFLYLSTKNLKQLQINFVKLLYDDLKCCYFSVDSPNSPISDKHVGISSLYARALGIKDGEVVTLTKVKQLPTIKRLAISPLNQNDYEVLEAFALDIQSSLLNHIKVLNNDQKIVVWIGKNLNVTVDVYDIQPISPGQIDNFTEVEIKPFKSKTEETSIEPQSRFQAFFNFFKTSPENKMIEKPIDIFEKYTKFRPSLILRSIPLEQENINIFNHPFCAFISKSATSCTKNSVETPQIYLASILTQVDDYNEKDSLFLRLYFIEDINDEVFIAEDEIVLSVDVQEYLEADVGSRILLEPFNDPLPLVEEIQISANRDLDQIIEHFKQYMADKCSQGDFIINANYLILIEDNIKITTNFNQLFCLVTSDLIRNCKYQKGDLLPLKADTKTATPPKPQYLFNIANYNNVIEDTVFILSDNFKSSGYIGNVLIEGTSGTGKTTVIKEIMHRLNSAPKFIFTKLVSCKNMKGKTLESLNKIFTNILFDLIHRQTSVLIIDDLHVLCQPINEGDVHIQNAVYYYRISNMLASLFEIFTHSNSIGILATTTSARSLNKCIYGSRGLHLFKNVFKIDELSSNDRRDLISHFLCNYNIDKEHIEDIAERTQNFVIGDLCNFVTKAKFEAMQTDIDASTITLENMETALEMTTVSFLHDIQLNPPGMKDFSDIGGLEEVKNLLIETLLWPSKYPNLFSGSPLRLPSGLLLYGPPGTGKTLLAGAAAKHCRLRLISIKGPELLSKYIGASEQAVRDVFQKAQSARPCILFFDEFDSLAPRRGHDNTGVTDRVVNQLLTQLDGVETFSGVFVLAASSRPDLLDPALLRPGRLDRHILCDLPNEKDRCEILKALSKSMKLAGDVDLEEIARKANWFSGADLQSVLYSAQLNAVENLISNDPTNEEIPEISQSQLSEALLKTRPSLSQQERLNYQRRYKKFERGTYEDIEAGTRATLA